MYYRFFLFLCCGVFFLPQAAEARSVARRLHKKPVVTSVPVQEQPFAQPLADHPVGECCCLYCHYEPRYSYDWVCVDEPAPYKKTRCRSVPKYYQVQCCRYVPEYYTQTFCRYEPEMYETDECTIRKKWVCQPCCAYQPCYYTRSQNYGEPVCPGPYCAQPVGDTIQDCGVPCCNDHFEETPWETYSSACPPCPSFCQRKKTMSYEATCPAPSQPMCPEPLDPCCPSYQGRVGH